MAGGQVCCLLLLVVVVPVPAHAFRLGASSAPRTYDRVGRALCASAVDGPGGTSAVEDVDKRLADCLAELQAADTKISKAEKALETTPDSETRARVLAALIELKNTVLKEKASLEAEKKDMKKEKDDEVKVTERKKTKTFSFTNPDLDTPFEVTIAKNEWDSFYADAGGGLFDVGDPDAKPVYGWEKLVDGKEYTVKRSSLGVLSASIQRQQETIDNRVNSDEDSIGRMLAQWTAKCYGDAVSVPVARKIYSWPTAEAAGRWNDLVRDWITATTEERAVIEEDMKSLKKESGIPQDDKKAKNTGKVLREYDAVVFSKEDEIVSVAEAKSSPSKAKIEKFAQEVEATKDAVNNADRRFDLFRDKKILPVFYGNRMAPETFWKRLAKENKVVALTRSGNENAHVMNDGAPQHDDNDDMCDFLSSLLK